MCTQISHPSEDEFFVSELEDLEDEDQDDDGQEDEEEWAEEMPRFGAWQVLFQPFFPEWRQNLIFPPWEPREGTFIFRVSLGMSGGSSPCRPSPLWRT